MSDIASFDDLLAVLESTLGDLLFHAAAEMSEGSAGKMAILAHRLRVHHDRVCGMAEAAQPAGRN